MTLRELLDIAGARPWLLVVLLLVPPGAVWITGKLHKRGAGGQSPWRYIYGVLVYAACVPGILAAVITAYALFFTGENLLDVNLLVYILPIVAMVTALILVGRNVELDEVAGFDRLWGLMVTIALSFGVALAISKTRIWLLFGASIWVLFAIAVVVFLLFRWAGRLLAGSSGEPSP